MAKGNTPAPSQPNIIIENDDKSDSVKYIVYGVIGVVVIGAVYFGIIRPITNAVGLTKDKEDREGDKAEDRLSTKDTLSPTLYKNNRDKVTIGSGRASELAYDIWRGRSDALGSSVCCDEEDLAVGGIKGAGTKVNVSYVGDTFQRTFGSDLHSYLDNDYLESEHWTQIDDHIRSIPKF
jgi:hypothetical protein